MTRKPPRVLAAGAVAVLLLAACGDDDAGTDADDVLRPPVAIQVAGVGGDPAGGRAVSELAADTAADDPAGTSMMAWWGFVYEVGDDLPALPTDSTAYQFPPGADVDADAVARLAASLGVEGTPERGTGADGDGVLWRVGPDDGTAPSVTVVANAELSWYFSGAWQVAERMAPESPPDAEPLPDDEPADAEPRPANEDPTFDAVTPEPPAGVPNSDEAVAEARRLLGELGQDADRFEADVYADEWFASVTMSPSFGAVRSPIGWGFGFGGGGALEWAHGSLATPVATGPYPLVDLDTALDRLTAQGGWGGLAGMPEPALVDPAVDDAVAPAVDDPVLDEAVDPDTAVSDQDNAAGTDVVEPDELVVDLVPVDPIEPGEPEVAVLVDVRADLWWAWDDDGSVWLLPAYTFTDTEGRVHTVPAVTDEFLIVPEPEPIPEPRPLPEPGVPEPGVEPVEPLPVDPVDGREPVEIDVDSAALVGLTLAEADDVVAAAGGEVRVIRLDGEDLAATMDFVPTRVNVAVEDDVVTEVLSIG